MKVLVDVVAEVEVIGGGAWRWSLSVHVSVWYWCLAWCRACLTPHAVVVCARDGELRAAKPATGAASTVLSTRAQAAVSSPGAKEALA